jgi:hypothetical protein
MSVSDVWQTGHVFVMRRYLDCFKHVIENKNEMLQTHLFYI